jgi:hypothetical protein
MRGSRNVGGVEITGGEVSVYKVSLVLTGLVLVCREEGRTVKECVHEAFKAAEMEIVGLMKFGDSSNKNWKDLPSPRRRLSRNAAIIRAAFSSDRPDLLTSPIAPA